MFLPITISFMNIKRRNTGDNNNLSDKKKVFQLWQEFSWDKDVYDLRFLIQFYRKIVLLLLQLLPTLLLLISFYFRMYIRRSETKSIINIPYLRKVLFPILLYRHRWYLVISSSISMIYIYFFLDRGFRTKLEILPT